MMIKDMKNMHTIYMIELGDSLFFPSFFPVFRLILFFVIFLHVFLFFQKKLLAPNTEGAHTI